MLKNKKWVIVAVALLIVFVVLTLRYFSARNNLETVSPQRAPIVEAVYGIGTVTSNKVFRLKSGIASQITKIYVKEGNVVTTGTPLLSTDEGVTSKAPFDGTIVSLPFSTGEAIFPQTVMLTLMDLKDRYIQVSLEQQGALRVKKGQKAFLSFESIRGQKFQGDVKAIYPNEDQFLVRIEVPDLPSEILPAMTADVAIEIAKKDDALLAPVSSLTAGQLSILRHGRLMKIKVDVGTVDGNMAEILSGDIQPDDQIVVKGK